MVTATMLTLTLQSLLFSISLLFFVFQVSLFFILFAFFLSFPLQLELKIRDREGTPKNLCDKDVAELSGELSGA